MTKKVSVVGFCQDSREYTPYEDRSMEVWGLNRGYIFMQRADRWFDMHSPGIQTSHSRRPGGHTEYLRQFKGPVYFHKVPEDIPNGTEYPLADVAKTVASNIYRVNAKGTITSAVDEPYLTSSVAQEIALAIHEGYEEIHLYGIDLNTMSEYAWQKPGVEYMLGLAAGKGIKVVLPDNCPLLKGDIYGRAYLSEKGPEQLTLAQLEDHLKALQKQREELSHNVWKLQGAEQFCREYVQAQMVPGLDHERVDKQRQQMLQTIEELQKRLTKLEGQMEATQHFIHQTPQGQDPKEAVTQYKGEHQDADGPVTELEAILELDANPAGKAEPPAPVVEFEPAIV